jgi:hypothetical protein
MSISQLLYISDATTPFSAGELQELVATSAQCNGRIHVTGLLLYSAGNFVQLLEGSELVLEELFKKISRDPRHRKVECLHAARCERRLFSKWHMGLLNGDDFNEMDRVHLRKAVTLLKHDPKACIITGVFREFRSRLPAANNAAQRIAAVQRRLAI